MSRVLILGMVLAVGLAWLMAVPAPAATDDSGRVGYISVQDYENGINSPTGHVEMAKLLDAMITGFEWANADLGNEHKDLLYCEPNKLPLTQDELVAIVNNYIREDKTQGYWPLGLTALSAMQETFPCPTGQ